MVKSKKTHFIVVNTDTIPGKEIAESLGVVEGSTVRSKNVGSDIFAGLKSIVGGELKGYTEMLETARQEAYNRMVNNAIDKGANAIVGMRVTTSAVTVQAAEILCYGTAVVVK